MSAADFWNNQEAAQTLIGELKAIKSIAEGYRSLHRDIEDELGIVDMCDESSDAEHLAEARGKIPAFARRVDAV